MSLLSFVVQIIRIVFDISSCDGPFLKATFICTVSPLRTNATYSIRVIVELCCSVTGQFFQELWIDAACQGRAYDR